MRADHFKEILQNLDCLRYDIVIASPLREYEVLAVGVIHYPISERKVIITIQEKTGGNHEI